MWEMGSDIMLVEFLGAAGVGKSFLSDRVLAGLRVKGIAAGNFNVLEIPRVAPRSLRLIVRAVYLGAMTRPKTLSFLAHAVEEISRYSIRREICEQIAGIHITSEGLFHRSRMLHRNSRALGVVQLADMLFRSIQAPDVVVVVESSPERIFARRSDRNRTNDLFSFESVRADIARVKESIEAIMHVQRTLHPPLRMIRVTTEEGGESAVVEIIDALERWIGNPRAVIVSRT